MNDDLLAATTVRCATAGADGWPHLVPLWFAVDGGDIWISTEAGSTKVRHLGRDPRATLLFDGGEHLTDLRGLMLRTTAVVHHDPATVARVNTALLDRYEPLGLVPDGFADVLRGQHRVAVRFRAVSTVTWDNRPRH